MTRQRAYQRRKREWLVTTKLASGCQSCGYRPRTRADHLHFHHRDPSTKLFNISCCCHSYGWTELRVEVAKCDVLCTFCHQQTDSYGGWSQAT
jgi:hypothetical protein